MAILDYFDPRNIKIFEQTNPIYEGLLGPEQSKVLSQRSNIAGLLGTAAALAAGMSRQGPRRSGLQNVLGALGAGYGASGQAYQGGIEQMANAQKLAQMKLQMQQTAATQQAVENLINTYPSIKDDPLKITYLRSNPSEALKLYSELLPIQEAARGTVSPSVIPTAVSPVAAPAPVVPVVPAKREYSEPEKAALADLDARIAADPFYKNRQAQAVSPNVSQAPIADQFIAAEQKKLQPAEVVGKPSRASKLIAQRDALINQMELFSQPQYLGNTRVEKIIENTNKSLETINKQIDRAAVEEFDFSGLKERLPPQYSKRVDDLEQTSGAMSMNELITKTEALSKEASEAQQKETDFTNDVRRTAKELFPLTPLHKLDEKQTKTLNAVLLQREEQLRKSGRSVTNIDMGQKTVAIERAKAQVASETAAEGALAVAGDVRAIVDVLKGYKGGKFDELQASLGPYFPGTNLAKISSAAGVAEALRAKIAPTLRVPGSGATSDTDIKLFLSAIPSLSQYADGRELLATYTQRFADRAAAAADIKGKMIEDGTYSLKAFQNELKKAGYETVLTPEDLQRLNTFQAQAGKQNVAPSSPAVNRAFEKHKPR